MICKNNSQIKKITKNCIICKAEFKIPPVYVKRYVTCGSDKCRKEIKMGKYNSNYRDGNYSLRVNLRQSSAVINWAKQVKARDNFTCLLCGVRGGNLESDHIKPLAYYPELALNLENGRTLCKPCHKKTYKDLRFWREFSKVEKNTVLYIH